MQLYGLHAATPRTVSPKMLSSAYRFQFLEPLRSYTCDLLFHGKAAGGGVSWNGETMLTLGSLER